ERRYGHGADPGGAPRRPQRRSPDHAEARRSRRGLGVRGRQLIPILSSAQARAFDRFLSERCAVPSLLLMENAGRGAARIIDERLSWRTGGAQRVLCVCGVGNTGGAGLVVARHLLALGHTPTVLLLGRAGALGGDARVNLEAWRG